MRRKQNVDSDVEKEMDDDGHRPFRDEILKTLDDDEGLHTRMSMEFGGVCVHPQNSISVSRAHYPCWLQRQARELRL